MLALPHVVRLAGQRALVHLEIVALNDDSVSRQQVACTRVTSPQLHATPAAPSLLLTSDPTPRQTQHHVRHNTTSDTTPRQTPRHVRPNTTSDTTPRQTPHHVRPHATSDPTPRQTQHHVRHNTTSDPTPRQTQRHVRPTPRQSQTQHHVRPHATLIFRRAAVLACVVACRM